MNVLNSLDPDVGPDLGPNCLQRLSADDPSRQKSSTLSRHSLQLLPALSSADVLW